MANFRSALAGAHSWQQKMDGDKPWEFFFHRTWRHGWNCIRCGKFTLREPSEGPPSSTAWMPCPGAQ